MLPEIVDYLRRLHDGSDDVYDHIKSLHPAFGEATQLVKLSHSSVSYLHDGELKVVQLTLHWITDDMCISFAYVEEQNTLYVYDDGGY